MQLQTNVASVVWQGRRGRAGSSKVPLATRVSKRQQEKAEAKAAAEEDQDEDDVFSGAATQVILHLMQLASPW